MQNQLPKRVKESRKNKIMKLQQKISEEIMKSKIGRTYEVILESITVDGKYFIARSYMDVPNEDGVIFIRYSSRYGLNEFVNCRIIDSLQYDLIGEIVE